MAADPLVDTQDQGPVRVLTVNHPPANSLNPAVREALGAALEAAAAESGVGCVVLTGAGNRFFMAGAQVESLLELDPAAALERVRASRDFLGRLSHLERPVIAAINGYCLGGGLEVALACDIRVASPGAQFGFPEVRLGLMPGAGGTQRLPRLVGPGAARRLILSGRPIAAPEALRLGLVDQLAGVEDALEPALDLARAICAQGPLAVRAAKKALLAAGELDLEAGLELENQLWAGLFASQDQKEGVEAFLQKRRPRFQGR